MKLRAFMSVVTRVVILLLSIGGASTGQVPGTDAARLIQHTELAMGCNALTPTTTTTAQGTLKASSIVDPMPVRIQTLGNDKWRSELDTPKEHKVTIVNSGRGQVLHADGRTVPVSESNTSHQRPMHIPCLTNLALPPGRVQASYLRVETLGSDTVDVVEILLTNRPSLKKAADLMRNVFWISRSTGYVVRLQYVNAAENDSNATEIVDVDYSDFRPINGVAIPFHQTTHAGNLTLDLQFDSVQLNTPAADFNLR